MELKLVFCDNLEGCNVLGVGRKFQEGGDICIYIWLIHVDIWQKPTQYCKTIVLQLKTIFLEERNMSSCQPWSWVRAACSTYVHKGMW